MAFGYNQPQNFGQTLSTVETIDFGGKVQTALQERFDVNNAKLDEAIMKVSSIPLLREKDQEYLKQKLSNVLNEVNGNLKASGGRTLLNNNLSGHLTKLIGSSIDDYLVGQMGIAQQKQALDTNVTKLKEKNDGTFNMGNYQFALDQAGWDDYISGKTDSLKGSLQYTPYSDWSANVTKKATELAKLKGKRTITIRNEQTGLNEIKEIDGLRPEEVAEYMPNLLSSQDLQQMRIDGYMQGKQDPEGTKAKFSVLIDGEIQKAETYKKAAEAVLSTSTDSEKIANAKKQIEFYDSQIKTYEESKTKTDPKDMGYTIVNLQGKQLLIKQLSTEESISYEMDDLYKFNAEMSMKKAQLEVDAEKNAIANGTSLAGYDPTALNQTDYKMEDKYSAVKNEHDQAYNRVVGMGLGVLEDSTIDQKQKDIYIAELNRNGFKVVERGDNTYDIQKDPNDKRGISKANAISESIKVSGVLPKNKLAELDELISDKNMYAKALIEANKSFGKDVDTDELVDDLVNTNNTLKGVGSVNANLSTLFRFFDPQEMKEAISNINSMDLTPSQKRRAEISLQIQSFISKNGGEKELSEKMKTNPALAKEVVDLINMAAEADSMVNRVSSSSTLTKNLNKAGEALDKAGFSDFMKDKYAIQISTEKAKEEVINSIDQNSIIGGKGFDAKKGGITATPFYNSRGQIDGFDIIQYNTEDKDGAVFTKARVMAGSLVAQKLLAKTAQGNEKDAMKVPSGTIITPMYKKIPTPFPTDQGGTDKELNDFYSLGLFDDPTYKPISVFFNSKNSKEGSSVRDNVITHFKSVLSGKYSDEQIAQIVDLVGDRFKKGEYTAELKTNKLPSLGTAKWVAVFQKDGVPIIPAYNFTESPTLPKSSENYFRAYPQYEFLNRLVMALKQDKIKLEDL